METLSVFDKFSEIFDLKKINQHVKLLEKGYKWHSAAYNASPYVNKLLKFWEYTFLTIKN